MESARRYLLILQAALLAGLVAAVRYLAQFMERRQFLLDSFISELSGDPPSFSLTPTVEFHRLPGSVDNRAAEPVSQPQIEFLNGNPDREVTAIFRLPVGPFQRSILVDLSEEEYNLLRHVCRATKAKSDTQVIVAALRLSAQILPKLNSGYLLHLEKTHASGSKMSFIYE